MVDLTAEECDVLITCEQGGISPVGKETASRERCVLTAPIRNQLIFAVTEEITIFEGHSEGTVQFHDAIGAVVDIGTTDCQCVSLTGYDAVSTAAIEITVGNINMMTARHTDDTTIAIAAFGMADRQILHLTVFTVYEVQAEGLAGIHLNAGVLLTTDDEVTEVL